MTEEMQREREEIFAADREQEKRLYEEYRKKFPEVKGYDAGPMAEIKALRHQTFLKLKDFAEKYGIDPINGKPYKPSGG